MPWRQEPKKDAVDCDKQRGVVCRHYIRGFPNGETHRCEPPLSLLTESIGLREGHWENRNIQVTRGTESIPLVVASERGTAQTHRFTGGGYRIRLPQGSKLQMCVLLEQVWTA